MLGNHGTSIEGLEARSARCRGDTAIWGQHTREGLLCSSNSFQTSHLSIHARESVYTIYYQNKNIFGRKIGHKLNTYVELASNANTL